MCNRLPQLDTFKGKEQVLQRPRSLLLLSGQSPIQRMLVREPVLNGHRPPLALLAGQPEKVLTGRFIQCRLLLQQFYATVVFKSGCKYIDADCLSRAPFNFAPASADDDDYECFLGAVILNEIPALQQDNPELRSLIEHLEGRGSTVPRLFSRALPNFVR